MNYCSYNAVIKRRVLTIGKILIMNKILYFFFLTAILRSGYSFAQGSRIVVPDSIMNKVYNEIKTPYKFGIVLAPENDSLGLDSPTVFRKGKNWYMTYIIFDGRGYESWIAESKDLLHWKVLGKTLSFSDFSDWDGNQKAGYLSLQDYKWGGKYKLYRFNGKYWMSYLGGPTKGYEAGVLSIGMAYTKKNPAHPHEWKRLDKPVLTIHDKDAGWWENITLYKSSVIHDKTKTLGYPFVMYYNAKGNRNNPGERDAERIGMAVSDDMLHWKRYTTDPVLDHQVGITGDAYIQKIGDLWVMFYFGAWWPNTFGAFNHFACSYDMVHWTDWKGEHLIQPSEPFDAKYAHKSSVLKHEGVVYHFYTATDANGRYRIAVATSKDLGKSSL